MEILGRNQTMPKKGRLGFLKKWIACVLIRNKPHLITVSALLTPYWVKWGSGGLRGGGTLGKCQGPRAFGRPRRFFGPRGCLWRHVFRDRTARFWADILYMYRGAGAPHESRTFLCN